MRYYFNKGKINWIYIISIVAAVVLSFIISYMVFTQIRENHDQEDPVLTDLKNKLIPLSPKVADLHFYKGNKSYTINKKKVYICLTDEHGQYYDKNFLTYVIIHELAHALTKTIGHNDEFYTNFDNLLKRAEEMGIYDPNKPHVTNYCNYS